MAQYEPKVPYTEAEWAEIAKMNAIEYAEWAMRREEFEKGEASGSGAFSKTYDLDTLNLEQYQEFFKGDLGGLSPDYAKFYLTKDAMYNPDGSPRNNLSQGHLDKVNAIKTQFEAFMAAVNPEKKRKDFLDMSEDMPGREATILTGKSPADFNGIAQDKTLIGGI